MRKPHGFTLIELLVAMIIITILASMVLFAMFKAQQGAREAKTKAIIVKLHTLIARHWDTYPARRIPVDTRDLTPYRAAELRLVALRQLMRLELPDRWSEVEVMDSNADGEFDALDGLPRLTRIDGSYFFPSRPQQPQLTVPAVTRAYYRYFKQVTPNDQFQNAECLYMIVTLGLAQEEDGLKLFSEQEVGDVDGDGAKEFLDGWGMPIRFLRWPAGFVNDPAQDATDYPFGHLSDLQPAKMPQGSTALYKECVPNARDHHDPFDPQFADRETDGTTFAFYVFPLIYSAGPDKIFDICTGHGPTNDPLNTTEPTGEDGFNDDPFYDYRNDASPCATYDPSTGEQAKYIGLPSDWKSFASDSPNGTLDHFDNIHNHLIDARLQ